MAAARPEHVCVVLIQLGWGGGMQMRQQSEMSHQCFTTNFLMRQSAVELINCYISRFYA